MGELQALDQRIRVLEDELAQERAISDIFAMAIGMKHGRPKATLVAAAIEAHRLQRERA